MDITPRIIGLRQFSPGKVERLLLQKYADMKLRDDATARMQTRQLFDEGHGMAKSLDRSGLYSVPVIPFGYFPVSLPGHVVMPEQVLEKIYDIAAIHHIGEERKDVNQSDYMIHILGTEWILVNSFGCTDPETVAAGFLHDVFENSIFHYVSSASSVDISISEARLLRETKVRPTREMIERLVPRLRQDVGNAVIGTGIDPDRIIALVMGLTKFKGLSSQDYYGRVAEMGRNGILLKSADKAYNLMDLVDVSDRSFVWRYIDQSLREINEDKIVLDSRSTTFAEEMPGPLRTKLRWTLFRSIFDNSGVDAQIKFNQTPSPAELFSLLERINISTSARKAG